MFLVILFLLIRLVLMDFVFVDLCVIFEIFNCRKSFKYGCKEKV